MNQTALFRRNKTVLFELADDTKVKKVGKLMNRLIEIRALNLKPELRAAFHELYIRESVPLLMRWNFDVVAYGPSLHDDDSYYVIRSFASLSERQQLEDAFYGSDDWRKGPRKALLGMIDSYTDTVFEVDDAMLQGLRRK